MYNVAFLFKQHLTDKNFSCFSFRSIKQKRKRTMIVENTLKISLWSFVFLCLDRDILIGGSTAGNGSDGCGSNEKLNTNGTNSSNSSGSGKKKKCKRRHR